MPTDEAIDLISKLSYGSAYGAATNPAAIWTEEQYQMANVLDALSVIHWRQVGSPREFTPEPIERPGDKQRRAKALQKAKSIKQKIENTQWKEA